MKKTILILSLCIGLVTSAFAINDSRLLRFPDVNKNLIVFVYAGDIWSVIPSSNPGIGYRPSNSFADGSLPGGAGLSPNHAGFPHPMSGYRLYGNRRSRLC